jgi:hypothetical protein
MGAGIRLSRARVATASTSTSTTASTTNQTAGMNSLGAVVVDGVNELTGSANGREWRPLKVAEIKRRFRHQQTVYIVGLKFEA